MNARYAFSVTFRLEPDAPGVSVSPAEFETRLYRSADEPGAEGWLFFRDNLWRGELGDEAHFSELATEALGVPVVDVAFRSLETDEEYFDALKSEIAANLDEFNADGVSEVLSKYLGSSIEVR